MDSEQPKFSAKDPAKCTNILANKYWNWVCINAYQSLADYHDAEEVTNDTFMRVYKYLQDRPELEIHFPKPFLREFLRYAVLQFRRQKARRLKDYVEISYNEIEEFSDAECQQLLETLKDEDWYIVPEKVVLSNEGNAIIVDAISQHPNATIRQILSLYIIQGVPPREIAEKLHLLENTVKSSLTRGKTSLRARLNQDER